MTTNSGNKLEYYESETASTLVTETVTRSHRFKVVGYSLNKGIGTGNCLTSATFDLNLSVYCPNGDNQECKDYQSFFLQLQDKGKEAKALLEFTILDQKGKPSTLSKKTENIIPFGSKIMSWGFTKFLPTSGFEASEFLKDDSFVMLCTVTVVKHSRPETVMVPPSNFNQQLFDLLEMGEGADISFKLSGQSFSAHKNVLAARSPVFRAQFFGLMKKKRKRSTQVDDIEPEVFRIFLRYIYSDSVSEVKDEDIIMYQHLLVVADLYQVERLKLICESKLSKNIEMKNFATILTLAEQHNCSKLKSSCFKFVSSPEILSEVMKTDGFDHMTQSCPTIMKEIKENMNKN